MSALIFIAFLDLERKSSFLDRHSLTNGCRDSKQTDNNGDVENKRPEYTQYDAGENRFFLLEIFIIKPVNYQPPFQYAEDDKKKKV